MLCSRVTLNLWNGTSVLQAVYSKYARRVSKKVSKPAGMSLGIPAALACPLCHVTRTRKRIASVSRFGLQYHCIYTIRSGAPKPKPPNVAL